MSRAGARNQEARSQKPGPSLASGSWLLASETRCLFIEGDPILELRQGRDPHCNAPVLGTHPYCARHCLRAYYRPEE